MVPINTVNADTPTASIVLLRSSSRKVTGLDVGLLKILANASNEAPGGISVEGRDTSRGSMAIEMIHSTGNITAISTRIASIWEMICFLSVILPIMMRPPPHSYEQARVQSETDSVARVTRLVMSVIDARTMNTMYANDAAIP